MASVADVLASPELALLTCLAGGGGSQAVTRVSLVEHTDDLEREHSGGFAVLSRAMSDSSRGYRVDLLLRLAASRGLAALAIVLDDEEAINASAHLIADRTGVALVAVPPETNLGGLCDLIGAHLRRGEGRALARLEAGLDAALAAETEGDPLPAVAAETGQALGIKLEVLDADANTDGLPEVVRVLADGQLEGYLAVTGAGDLEPSAVRLGVHMAGLVASRGLSTTHRLLDLPTRSRSQVLAELLLAPADRTRPLLRRARTLGVAVDGWHVVCRIEATNVEDLVENDEVKDLELREAIGRLALSTARASEGNWHLVRIEEATLLVRTFRDDPGRGRDEAAVSAIVENIVGALRSRFPRLEVRAGIGSPHPGAAGLRASAAEARTAAALASQGAERVVKFDTAGLHRMLIEWYASDAARDAVDTLLLPLRKLGPRKQETMIHTLGVYLDQKCSLTDTAAALHLHRNSVAYRIDRIFSMLSVDPTDPDHRLALQLACRAHGAIGA